MSKFVFGRIAVYAAIAALAACGDSDSSSAPTASAASTATAPSAMTGTGNKQSTTTQTATSGTSATITTTSQTAATAARSTLKMSAASYSVTPAAGTAVLTVERVGASGTTAVQYATANGSAKSGVDYTAASGILTWADGDTSIKKIFVPVGAKASGKNFQVALTPATANASVASPTATTVMITAQADAVPPAAELAGYTKETFGPALTMGDNWHDMSFFGWKGAGGANSSDGTVAVSGNGVGSISTAAADSTKPHNWKGVAFGGGAYFEAVFSFEGADAEKLSARWPAFWANDIENMSANGVTEQTQWAGQANGFGNWVEADFFEYDAQNLGEYGIQIHNWYGFHTKGEIQDVRAWTSPVKVPAGFKWSDTHKYGFLWVPATDSTKGYAQVYLDDVPMGKPVYWNKYDPKAPPAPSLGNTAFSVMDSRHMALIIDTGPKNPMTIHSVTVWQQTDANNLKQ